MQLQLRLIFIFGVHLLNLNTGTTALLDPTDEDAEREQYVSNSDSIQPSVESSNIVNDTDDGCQVKGDNVVTTTGNGSRNSTSSTGSANSNPLANGLVSPDLFGAVSNISSKFTIPILVIALLCNICSAVVYTNPVLRSTTSIYLIFLACTDTVYVVCVLILEITSAIFGDGAIHVEVYLTMAIYLGNYISVCCRRLAYIVTSMVSLERLIGIAFPLRARHLRTLKSPKIVLPMITVCLLCYHIFSPLKLRVIPASNRNNGCNSNSNSSEFTMAVTTLYRQNVNAFEIVGIVGKALFVFLPLVGCLLFNILLITCLKKHSKIRRSLSNSLDSRRLYHNERQTTITIIVSTFIYVVLNLPVNVSSLVANIVPDYAVGRREHYLFLLMNVVGYICENISNITNFIAYLALSSRFRRVLFRRAVYANTIQGHKGRQGRTVNPDHSLKASTTEVSATYSLTDLSNFTDNGKSLVTVSKDI